MYRKHSKEYVVSDNALLSCSEGKEQGYFLAEQEDKSEMFLDTHRAVLKTNTGLSGFGVCNLTEKPCTCEPSGDWNVICLSAGFDRIEVITSNSCLACKKGGMITIDEPGQYEIKVLSE